MPVSKPAGTIPPATLALYERLVATVPNLERKGAALPYTSVNGHMFSYLNAEGVLALRLPPQARAEFMQKYKAPFMVAYGIVQKEYVAVPETLFKKTKELHKYFALSFDFVSGLRPKPTKKTKTAAR